MTGLTYYGFTFLSGAVALVLLLLPLRRRLKVPLVWGTVCLVAALALASIPAFIMGYQPASQSYFMGALVNTAALLLASVLVLHKLTGARCSQLVFLLLLTKSYNEYVLTLSLLCWKTFFPQSGDMAALLFMLAFYAMSLPLMMLFFAKLVRPLFEEGGALPFWRYLWLIPVGFYGVYCLGVYTDYIGTIGHGTSRTGVIILLFWILGSFATYFVVVKMLSITVEAARIQQQLTTSELQIEIQHQRLGSLQAGIDEARRAKHDLRHHINTLRGLLQRGDLDKVAEYLDQYAASLPDAQQTFCENPSVDAILGYYAALCDSSRIRYQFTARLPQSLGGKEQDVCAVLSNLLENACEACARQAQGPRTLEVKAALSGQDMLAITVHNSYGGRVETDSDGLFYSSKRPGKVLGIGTQSVRGIAAHSGGLARFSHTEQTFTASVLLHL